MKRRGSIVGIQVSNIGEVAVIILLIAMVLAFVIGLAESGQFSSWFNALVSQISQTASGLVNIPSL